jgi:hypothetical protein
LSPVISERKANRSLKPSLSDERALGLSNGSSSFDVNGRVLVMNDSLHQQRDGGHFSMSFDYETKA